MNQEVTKHCKSVLKKNHLHPLKKLGKGTFATVFLVEKISLQKNQNQLYSVKCINKKQITKRPSLNKYIKQEIQILRNIDHQNVVKSLRTFEDEGWIFMVMEYCDRGNLNAKISESKGGVLSLQQTFYIVSDIIKGLEYMHKLNLLHRDIKAQNILLTNSSPKKQKRASYPKLKKIASQKSISSSKFEYTTKLCDFGFSRAFEEDECVNTFCGTACYMAPEIFKKSNYDQGVDIWALGVLVFYMLFGVFPFKSLNVEYQIEKKCGQGFSIAHVPNIKQNNSISKQNYSALQKFFQKVFTIYPEDRLTLRKFKLLPWLQKYQKSVSQVPRNKELGLSHSVSHSSKLVKRIPSQKDKTTIDSQDSSYQAFQNPCTKNQRQQFFELAKYYFVKQIIQDIEGQRFLKVPEQIAFQYYMFKMISTQFNWEALKKLAIYSKKIKKEKEKTDQCLSNFTKLMKQNLGKINIPKFQPQKHFNVKAQSFNEIKQSYRLVIGHVFAKAHKNITQDIYVRSQLKLKLFICHVINRAFNPEHNQGIFLHFQAYRKKTAKDLSPKRENFYQQFSFKQFKKWIQQQEPEKLVQTIQFMNTKFYKGK